MATSDRRGGGDEREAAPESDVDFTDVRETVSTDDFDVSEDDYPVLQWLDRATQLAVR